MEISYCDKWANIKKSPWHMLDENAARECHAKRQPYTAILSENGQPKYIIHLVKDFVSVAFWDELLRKYLQYDFKEVQKGKLFLGMAIYWEYEDDSDSETSSTIFAFRENGHIIMEKRNLKTGEVEERQTHDSVEPNWDDYPQFGQYMHLCKEER